MADDYNGGTPADDFLAAVERRLNEGRGADAAGIPEGTLILIALLDLYGGQRIYLPKSPGYLRHRRDMEILSRFKGDNYEELAQAFGLDERHVRRIVHGKDGG